MYRRPPPQKKSGEETPLLIFPEGGGGDVCTQARHSTHIRHRFRDSRSTLVGTDGTLATTSPLQYFVKSAQRYISIMPSPTPSPMCSVRISLSFWETAHLPLPGWIEKENDIRDIDEISSRRMPNSSAKEAGIRYQEPPPPPLSRPYFMWVFPRMKLNPGYVLIEMNIWIPGVNNSIIKSWHCYRFSRSVSVYYTYNVTRTDYLPLSLLSETCRPSDMFRRAMRYFRTQCLVYLPSPC